MALTVAGTAPDFRRLPFEPPPPDLCPWAAPWSIVLLGREGRFAKRRRSHYGTGMTSNHARLTALLSAIAVAAALRLVPHPPNFTPIGAMALFSGAYFGRRAMAFAAPLGAMLIADLILGFDGSMPFVYAGVMVTVLVGWLLGNRRNPVAIGTAAIASSVAFFLLTNFGVWATGSMYPMTGAGLAACYVAAIPFFQNSLAGDLFYTALLFGGFALLERAVPAVRLQSAATA